MLWKFNNFASCFFFQKKKFINPFIPPFSDCGKMSLPKYPAPYWSKPPFLVRNVFVTTNCRDIVMMFDRPSVWDGGAL